MRRRAVSAGAGAALGSCGHRDVAVSVDAGTQRRRRSVARAGGYGVVRRWTLQVSVFAGADAEPLIEGVVNAGKRTRLGHSAQEDRHLPTAASDG